MAPHRTADGGRCPHRWAHPGGSVCWHPADIPPRKASEAASGSLRKPPL